MYVNTRRVYVSDVCTRTATRTRTDTHTRTHTHIYIMKHVGCMFVCCCFVISLLFFYRKYIYFSLLSSCIYTQQQQQKWTFEYAQAELQLIPSTINVLMVVRVTHISKHPSIHVYTDNSSRFG